MCTLVQALRLCTDRTAYRGSRGIALLFHDHATRRGWGVSVTPRPLFTPGKDLVHIVQEAGWVPGPVWTGAENLAPTGIRSPDRPARSQSLYRLRYPAHIVQKAVAFKQNCDFWCAYVHSAGITESAMWLQWTCNPLHHCRWHCCCSHVILMVNTGFVPCCK